MTRGSSASFSSRRTSTRSSRTFSDAASSRSSSITRGVFAASSASVSSASVSSSFSSPGGTPAPASPRRRSAALSMWISARAAARSAARSRSMRAASRASASAATRARVRVRLGLRREDDRGARGFGGGSSFLRFFLRFFLRRGESGGLRAGEGERDADHRSVRRRFLLTKREVGVVRSGFGCRVPRRLHRGRLVDLRLVRRARLAQSTQRVGARLGDFPHRRVARRARRLRRACGVELGGVPRVRGILCSRLSRVEFLSQPRVLLRLRFESGARVDERGARLQLLLLEPSRVRGDVRARTLGGLPRLGVRGEQAPLGQAHLL